MTIKNNISSITSDTKAQSEIMSGKKRVHRLNKSPCSRLFNISEVLIFTEIIGQISCANKSDSLKLLNFVTEKQSQNLR